MFFRFKNILLKNQLNKRFFSNNCNNNCKFNIDEIYNVKKMLQHIYIMSFVNYCLTLVILIK
jgi:hypothetical protein